MYRLNTIIRECGEVMAVIPVFFVCSSEPQKSAEMLVSSCLTEKWHLVK